MISEVKVFIIILEVNFKKFKSPKKQLKLTYDFKLIFLLYNKAFSI